MTSIPSRFISEIRKTAASLATDNRVRSGLVWSLVASMALRATGLVTSLVVSRMLGKEQFGEYSIALGTVMTFGVFAGVGAGLTALKHIAEMYRSDPSRAGRILALSMVMASVFGAVMTLLLVLASPFVASTVLGAPQLTASLRIASVNLFASVLSGAQAGALAGFEAFRLRSRVFFFGGILTVAAVGYGTAMHGLAGALWGYNIATFVICYLGYRALNRAGEDRNVRADYRTCLREWPVFWQFSLPSMLSQTFVTFAIWICSAMLVNRPQGLSEVAVYSAVTQWRQFLLFLPDVVAQVFLPLMASGAAGGGPPARALYLKANILIAAPVLLGLSALSPLIMGLYGDGYLSHWPVFVVVQIATFVQIVQSPNITSWQAEGRAWTSLFANTFWGAALVLFSRLLIGRGAMGLALALLASFLLYFGVISAVNRRAERGLDRAAA